jgi:hypothetical protein
LLMLPLDDLMSQGECWKVRSMHHDACTHVRVLGHQNNMRDNKEDNPAGPADCC